LGRAYLSWLRHKCLLLACPFELVSGETVRIECEVPSGPVLSFEGRIGAPLPLGVYAVKMLPSLDARMLHSIAARNAARLLARMIESPASVAPIAGCAEDQMPGDEKTVSEDSTFVADSIAVEMFFEADDEHALTPTWRRDTAAAWRALSVVAAALVDGRQPLVEPAREQA